MLWGILKVVGSNPSLYNILSHLFLVKIVLFAWKRPKKTKKRLGMARLKRSLELTFVLLLILSRRRSNGTSQFSDSCSEKSNRVDAYCIVDNIWSSIAKGRIEGPIVKQMLGSVLTFNVSILLALLRHDSLLHLGRYEPSYPSTKDLLHGRGSRLRNLASSIVTWVWRRRWSVFQNAPSR